MMHRLFPLLVAGTIAAGCSNAIEHVSVLTCSSPSGAFSAEFYVEQAGGAAGSQYEFVGVQARKGKPVIVLMLRGGYDAVLEWRDDTTLAIAYPDQARVDHWQSWLTPMTGGRVEVPPPPSRH